MENLSYRESTTEKQKKETGLTVNTTFLNINVFINLYLIYICTFIKFFNHPSGRRAVYFYMEMPEYTH